MALPEGALASTTPWLVLVELISSGPVWGVWAIKTPGSSRTQATKARNITEIIVHKCIIGLTISALKQQDGRSGVQATEWLELKDT